MRKSLICEILVFSVCLVDIVQKCLYIWRYTHVALAKLDQNQPIFRDVSVLFYTFVGHWTLQNLPLFRSHIKVLSPKGYLSPNLIAFPNQLAWNICFVFARSFAIYTVGQMKESILLQFKNYSSCLSRNYVCRQERWNIFTTGRWSMKNHSHGPHQIICIRIICMRFHFILYIATRNHVVFVYEVTSSSWMSNGKNTDTLSSEGTF